jgi:dolichyl-phosphate-mannose-protein mannosyltransferase
MTEAWTHTRTWLFKPRNLLLLLLLLAFALRVSCILWGIPILPFTGRYHADEGVAYGHAFGFPGNYFTNPVFVYGTTLPYLVATFVLPLKSHVTPASYELICWMGLRIVSVLTGTGSVAVVYLVAKRLYDARTGLLAAVLLAVAFSHCMNSSYANFDVPISFLVILSFYLVLRGLDHDRLRDFVYLGLVAGVLVGTKVTMIIAVIIPVAVIFILRLRKPPNGAAERPLLREFGRWSLCLGLALIVFAVSNFHVIRHFGAFLAHWKEQKYLWYDRSSVPFSAVPEIWWRYTGIAIGPPTVVLALIGLFRLGRPDFAVKVSIVAYLVAHYVLLRHHFYARSAVEIAPLACLLAARACGSFLDHRIGKPIAYAAAASAILFSLTMSVRGVLTRLDDPRTKAARYLATEIPAGSTIGIASPYRNPRVASWQWPPLGKRQRSVNFLELPDYLIVTSDDQYIMGNALRSEKLGTNDIWNPAFARDWYNYEPPPPKVFQFYRGVLNGTGPYTLIKSFDLRYTNPKIEFGDIAIRIYHKVSPG